MGQPITIHSAYAGMARDFSRDQLPAATLWNLVDYIPNNLGAPLRKRGGWVYASSAVSAGSYLKRVMYGEAASGGVQLLAIDSVTSTSAGAGVWKINESTGALTFVGSVTSCSAAAAAGTTLVGDPVFFGKRWFIPNGYVDSIAGVSANSACACTIYDGTTIEKISAVSADGDGGSVYGARFAEVHRSRVVLANSPNAPRRLWFSKAGDRKSKKFTDPDSWLDVPVHITGLCSLPTCLVVFGTDRCVRIRGTTPPPGSDFTVDLLYAEGCSDYRSIATWSGKAIYANTNGVFLTDGIDTTDLTLGAGMSSYYRNLLSTYTSSWTLRGEVFRNYYFLAISDNTNTFQDCLVCDLRVRAWFRVSNFNFSGFSVGTGSAFQQFYASSYATNRVVRVTDIFAPAAANKADADGTSVLPVVEYPCRRGFFRQQRRWLPTEGLTRWKRLYLSYDLRDAATDNPTLSLSYVTTPAASSYTALSKTLAETTDFSRSAFDFAASGERGGKTMQAFGLKVTQVSPSSDTRLYTLQAELEAIEGSRI